MKNFILHNADILEKFLKDYTLNKKYIAIYDFEILGWLYVTFNDLHGHTLFYEKKLSPYVSNHRNFYQNQFINEYATKKKS